MINIVSMSSSQQNKLPLFSKKNIILLLIATNLVSIFLLLNIHHNISKGKKQHLLEQSLQDTLSFENNPTYIEQTALFEIYKKQPANIVMLGSSFTQRVNWNELLNRDDVANRGIGSDISFGYLQRLKYVLNLHPAICFIEIGANDIIRNIPIDTVFNNTISIIDTLLSYHISVVVSKCFYASVLFPNFKTYNKKVDSLNALFDKIGNKVTILDINPMMSDRKIRKTTFCLKDGIHLNAAAYLLWKTEIEKVLLQYHLVDMKILK